MKVNEKILFSDKNGEKTYLVRLDEDKYECRTVFENGEVISSRGTFKKVCKAIRHYWRNTELDVNSNIMQILRQCFPWFKFYDYEVADTLRCGLALLLIALKAHREDDLVRCLLDAFELSEEKLPEKLIGDIDLSEKATESLNGNELYYKSAGYEFTYKYDDYFVHFCGASKTASYRKGKKAITTLLREKLNGEIDAMHSFDKAGYKTVKLKNEEICFKQNSNASRFDYERYDVFVLDKVGRAAIRKRRCELCDFVDFDIDENALRAIAEDDDFFLSHIDFYLEQARNASFKSIEILSTEQQHTGMFSIAVKYFVDFLGDGKRYNSVWRLDKFNELALPEGKTALLTEAQAKALARYAFEAHGREISGKLSNWRFGYFDLIEGQFIKAEKCCGNAVKSVKQLRDGKTTAIIDYLREKLNIDNKECNGEVTEVVFDTSDGKLEKLNIKLCSIQKAKDNYAVYSLTDRDGNGIKAVCNFGEPSKSIEYELNLLGVDAKDLTRRQENKLSLYRFIYYSYVEIFEGEEKAFVSVTGGNTDKAWEALNKFCVDLE